jgi:hypothetical protein
MQEVIHLLSSVAAAVPTSLRLLLLLLHVIDVHRNHMYLLDFSDYAAGA